jgi:hypothetical protein|tara:strand:- start:127 stop:345 length:219 start_codon:yes stop_codon:yes gene_type:complete
MRITIRLNELEKAELNLFKVKFGMEKDSEAFKLALKWVNHYIKNVTEMYFPPEYDIILTRKLKTTPLDRKIF